MSLGDYDAAIDDASAAIDITPSYAYAYVLRGDALGQLGFFEQAIDDYNQAILNSPTYTYAFVQRGYAYYEIGEVDTALDDLELALANDSTYSYAYSTRARIYAGIEDYDLALEDYAAAIDFNDSESNRLNYIERAVIYGRLGDDAVALEDVFKFTQLYSEGITDEGTLSLNDSTSVNMCDGCIYAFSLSVTEGATLSVSVTDIDPRRTIDPLLVILDPDGIPVAVDDDSGEAWGSQLEFEARDTGTHTVYVTHAYSGSEGQVGIVIESVSGG
jgi:tetratricopeptide (TPR) repeat protein